MFHLCLYPWGYLYLSCPYWSFPGGSVVKNPSAKAGDTGSIPGLGRSPGEGNDNPLQYSLENARDRGVWWAIVHGATKHQTWVSHWTTTAARSYGGNTVQWLIATRLSPTVFSDITVLAEWAMVGTWTPWKSKNTTKQICHWIDLKVVKERLIMHIECKTISHL